MWKDLPLRPAKGGFLRPFGCGEFIREFLMGWGTHGSPTIDPNVGAPQSDMFFHYKQALIQSHVEDSVAKEAEQRIKKDLPPLTAEETQEAEERYRRRIPYKTTGCRYHSFVVYFSNLRRLGWVEPSGYQEVSAFQGNYASGQPRVYYRLAARGRAAPAEAWANPMAALYSRR